MVSNTSTSLAGPYGGHIFTPWDRRVIEGVAVQSRTNSIRSEYDLRCPVQRVLVDDRRQDLFPQKSAEVLSSVQQVYDLL